MDEVIYLPDGNIILGSSPSHFKKMKNGFVSLSDNIQDAVDYHFSKKVQKEFQ